MTKNRLEAFSDGVLAIIITIMVLELRPPAGISFTSLQPLIPKILSYVMSFALNGAGKTKIVMNISIVGFFINALLNYI